MSRRIRNVVLFVGALFGTALLAIGATALMSGDQSGVRAIIGAVLAFALTGIIAARTRGQRAPE